MEYLKKDLKDTKELAYAYIRVPEELKAFLNALPEIHAVDIDGWNMGFAVDRAELDKRNETAGRPITYVIPEKDRNENI